MNSIDKAKNEFLKLGYKPIEEYDQDNPDRWIQENVLELLEVFSKQGHSGFSAAYVINLFSKLAKHEPLTPIMCTDDEWSDINKEMDADIYQNNRCSAVFKNGKNGKPYYLDAIVWRNQKGVTFTGTVLNSKKEKIYSHQTIKMQSEPKTFYFEPKSFYIDVIEEETSDDWVTYIKDDIQLKKVWKYYEHQETPSYLRYKKLKSLE